MSCRSRIFMVYSFRLFSYETCWANNSSLGATIDKKQNLFQRLISIKFSVGKSLFLKKVTYVYTYTWIVFSVFRKQKQWRNQKQWKKLFDKKGIDKDYIRPLVAKDQGKNME